MGFKLVIEDDAVYEIDEDCLKNKDCNKRRQKERDETAGTQKEKERKSGQWTWFW